MLSGGPFPVDLAFSQWIQGWQTEGLTTFMKAVSFIGQPLLYIPLLILLAAWWYNQGKQSLAILILVVVTGNLLSFGLKEIFDRPRPTVDDVVILEQTAGKSFPSAHALSALLAGGLGMYLAHLGNHAKGFFMFFSLIFIITVGVSRIYVGAHWLTDVLGGYVAGLFWLLIVFWAIWPKIRLRLVQAEQASIEVVQ